MAGIRRNGCGSRKSRISREREMQILMKRNACVLRLLALLTAILMLLILMPTVAGMEGNDPSPPDQLIRKS